MSLDPTETMPDDRAYPPPPPIASKKLSRSRTRWIIGGSIALLIAVIGSIIGLAIFVVTAIADRSSTEALVTGETATPLAKDALDCSDECFGDSALRVPFPAKTEFDALRLTIDDETMYASESVSQQLAGAHESWAVDHDPADSCFTAYPEAPITKSIPADIDLQRRSITIDGAHTDEWGTARFSQTVRIFPNSTTAVDHMVQLDTEIGQCSNFKLDGVLRTVSRPPALDLPASVAAVGWVESTKADRYYVYDLQRGNFVVRSTLWSTGTISERQFRDVMEVSAERLSKMKPD